MFLSLEFVENRFQAIEPGGPELAVLLDPGSFLRQRQRAQSAGSHPADLPGGDEARPLEDADVLLHAREGHLKPRGKLGDGSVPTSELLQDTTAGGVRKRGEGRIEASLILNHVVQYSA